jgi:putative transposase
MQLVERHILKGEQYHELCVKAKNLYNQSLYYWRQSIFGNIEYFSEFELTGLLAEYNEENYKSLPAQTSQQVIKLLFKNIKSWQKARKEYTKTPSKFLGRPKLPKYKKETSIVCFTNQQVKLKDGFVYFPKMTNLEPLKTKVNNVCQVRIIPNSNHFTVEVVYEKQQKKLQEYNSNWMGIDLGLNNLATCVTKETGTIYNGKPLKSINHFYNNRKSQLQSLLPQGSYLSKRINRLTSSRNNKVENYIHQISNKIIKQAQNEDITKVIIGNNKNWKQDVNLGKKTNRNFVSIPHSSLIEKIQYKGLMVGIEVLVTQEAYTSKCSALDLEPIQKHDKYVGKRKKRGLFVTAEGKLINADCNGSLNIARLGLSVSGNEMQISDSVMRAALAPKKINVSTRNSLVNKYSLTSNAAQSNI